MMGNQHYRLLVEETLKKYPFYTFICGENPALNPGQQAILPRWLSDKIAEYIDNPQNRRSHSDYIRLLLENDGPWPYSHFNQTDGLVWYNNPKCASSSIKRALGIRIGTEEAKRYQKWSLALGCTGHRNCLLARYPDSPLVIELPKVNLYDKEKYFTFAFVRNPYDRLYSAFKMIRIIDREQKRTITSDDVFDNFNLFASLVSDRKIVNDHISSQTYYVPTIQHKVNFIGKFENLSDDWKKLNHTLDNKWHCNTLPKEIPNIQPRAYGNAIKNQKKPPPPAEVSIETFRKLQSRFKEDFEHFDYDPWDPGGIEIK